MPDMTEITKLDKISLDFKNRKFMINETDIGLYSGVKIIFKDGRWTVKLKSQARFDIFGKMSK
ncbi:MAG: hypothetical protein K2J40_05355 [Ruminococcus sp.]|nr:hypothetical protein [Ruminococcus sp.]